MSAVVNLINIYRDVLILSTDTDCLNGLKANEVMSYFEHNLLKYCVLVVDVDKIKAVLEQERGVNLRLLQTADRNVGKFLTHWFAPGIFNILPCQVSENYKLVLQY